VGMFILAALLLDGVLWVFVLLGWESVTVPASFASTHQLAFVFPYSYGLLASVGWSVLAGAAALLARSGLGLAKLRRGALVAAAVFTHWLLDALVHVPELPITGAASAKVGLGLWQNMPVALCVEALLVAAGLFIFLPGASLSGARKIGLTMLALVVLGFTVVGMTLAPPPPSTLALAASSLATAIVVCSVATWLGRVPSGRTGRQWK